MQKSVAMQRMLEIKAESPKLDTVQYYWLDDLVERVEFKGDTMQVFWKCGLTSEIAMNIPDTEKPESIAERYLTLQTRAMQSENKPMSMVRIDKKAMSAEKPVSAREAQRNAAMQAAKNLRAKKNAAASGC